MEVVIPQGGVEINGIPTVYVVKFDEIKHKPIVEIEC